MKIYLFYPKLLSFSILLAFMPLFSGCQINRSSSEFEQVYGARYLPERFYPLGEVSYELNGRKRIRYVGAYKVEEKERWGLVWADYTQDRNGDWYRQSYMDTPFAYTETTEMAKKVANEYLAQAPFTSSWADE